MRGFFSVGLVAPQNPYNAGAVLRAAHCYGAASVVIERPGVNVRDLKGRQNTPQAHRHMPTFLTDDLLSIVPVGASIVAVDLLDGAHDLPSFVHPERAVYVFGPEGGTLSGAIVERATYRVMVPTRHCMNLSACVNVVLYDRMAKALAKRSAAA